MKNFLIFLLPVVLVIAPVFSANTDLISESENLEATTTSQHSGMPLTLERPSRPPGETIFYRGPDQDESIDGTIYQLDSYSGAGSYDLNSGWFQAGLWNTNGVSGWYQVETVAWYGYSNYSQTFYFYLAPESGGSVGGLIFLGSIYDSSTGSATWHTFTLPDPYTVYSGNYFYLVIKPATYTDTGYWWCSNTSSTSPHASMTSTDGLHWSVDYQGDGYEYLPGIQITGQAHPVGSNIYLLDTVSGAGSYDLDMDWYQACLWNTNSISQQYQIQSIGWYGYQYNSQVFRYYLADVVNNSVGPLNFMGTVFDTRTGSGQWHYITLKNPGSIDPYTNYYFVVRPTYDHTSGYWWCSDTESTSPRASYTSTDGSSWSPDDNGSGYAYLGAIHVTGTSGSLGSVVDFFEAYPMTQAAYIEWRTTTEVNLIGFNLYRSKSPNTGYEQINESLFDAHYGDPEGYVYRWWDENLTSCTTYYYKLESLYSNGDSYFEDAVWARPLPTHKGSAHK